MGLLASNVTMLILLALFLTVCNASDANTKVHVNITNALTGSMSMAVHCKTRFRDLGGQEIPHGSSFEFNFDQGFFTKRLDCNVHWEQAVAHRFIAYDHVRDEDKCSSGYCMWSIRSDAACMYNNQRKDFDCSAWPHH